VRCPALVVEPDEDRVIPLAHCRRWAELLPNARLEHVAGEAGPTGHALIMQEPDRAAAVVGGFISEVER
jgi:pimeloyl-ACP methyl ester carboxylesterase